jgi:hypothetical protein
MSFIAGSLSAPRRGVPSRPSLPIPALLLALLAAAPAALAQATAPARPEPDVIVFTNGDRLTGMLERGVGNTVIFKSDVAGEITVPLTKVKELHSNGSFAVLLKGVPVSRKAVVPGTVLYGEGTLTVAIPTGAPQTVPADKIAYIIDQPTYDRELEKRPGPLFGWHGAVNGGATVVRSTQTGETFTAGINLVRALPGVPFLPARNRTTFNLTETYGKLTQPVIPQTTPPSPNNVAVTSIFHTDAERDEYFSPRFFALAQTAFDHNFSQGLNLQQVYGAGVGWTPLKSATRQLDLKVNIQYEKQDFEAAASNQNLIGSTISEAYRRTLPRKLLLTQTLNVLPAFNVARAYSANATVALALPVYKRLSLNVSSTDNFLNDPPTGFQKNSFQFVTGIAYTLK